MFIKIAGTATLASSIMIVMALVPVTLLYACQTGSIIIMGSPMARCEFVILRQNDLKLGIHVHCIKCAVQCRKTVWLGPRSRSHILVAKTDHLRIRG